MGSFAHRALARKIIIGCVLLVSACAIRAQSFTGVLSSAQSKGPATAPLAIDPLNRVTPRKSIYSFLEACHSQNYALAADYLDLRKLSPGVRSSQGPELARELGALLDRDPHFEVDQLSDTPAGNQADGLAPNVDNLVTLQLNQRTVSLQLARVNQAGTEVWLVSADSVLKIPELSSLAAESSFEKKLPAPLVNTKLLGTALWVWIALVLLALILSLLSRVLSHLVIGAVKPVAKHYAKSLSMQRLEHFTGPVRLLVAVAIFRTCMEVFAPSALLRYFLLRLLTALFIFGAIALLMRVVDVISDQWMSRRNPRERALSYSILSLGVRFIKICLFCVAVLFILSDWGFNTNAILAGVGVGGLAVALAAQKTIENLFGGISVITDRPVLVGDFCKFGDQLGTVEDIGLRSTRIRTLDRTVVTVPNSQFSTMTLENYSRRDRVWFHPTLHVRRDTTPAQIREMMNAVTKTLEEHPMVDASGVPLRFTNIGQQSFDIDIFAYVLTADYNQFLKIQSELLLKFMDAASALGIGFAVPIQESMPPPEPGNLSPEPSISTHIASDDNAAPVGSEPDKAFQR